MLLGEAEGQVVEHDAFAHRVALQILQLVGLRPRVAVEVGIVHGDGSVNKQTVFHLKLE